MLKGSEPELWPLGGADVIGVTPLVWDPMKDIPKKALGGKTYSSSKSGLIAEGQKTNSSKISRRKEAY